MQKYKIEFTQTNKYIIDIQANTEEEAKTLAKPYLEQAIDNAMEHYNQIGDTELEVSNVFDVTNTDDPFDPEDNKGEI